MKLKGADFETLVGDLHGVVVGEKVKIGVDVEAALEADSVATAAALA